MMFPLSGFMRDITGGYEMCFYCMGTCMVLGGVPLLLVRSVSYAPASAAAVDRTSSTTDRQP